MYKKTVIQLRALARKLGATDARVIPVKKVKTAAWVRYKCQFGCSGFGESLTCPPYSPAPEQTQKILDCYNQAILIHVHKGTHVDISEIALKLETAAFLAGYYKAIAFGAGPCRLCRVCALHQIGTSAKRRAECPAFCGTCRHAQEARPSMEACGIDVFATARGNGYVIETLDSTRCEGNYFGLVLIQ